MEELLDLIALVYWHDNEECGTCHNYEFCKKYSEAKTMLEVQRLAKEIKELDDARCRRGTH